LFKGGTQAGEAKTYGCEWILMLKSKPNQEAMQRGRKSCYLLAISFLSECVISASDCVCMAKKRKLSVLHPPVIDHMQTTQPSCVPIKIRFY